MRSSFLATVRRVCSVSAALVPLTFGLVRAVTTGSDRRYVWTALAGSCAAMAMHRLLSSRTPGSRKLLQAAAAAAGGGACAAASAALLGATSVPAILVVAMGFGGCWAIATLLWPAQARL